MDSLPCIKRKPDEPTNKMVSLPGFLLLLCQFVVLEVNHENRPRNSVIQEPGTCPYCHPSLNSSIVVNGYKELICIYIPGGTVQ